MRTTAVPIVIISRSLTYEVIAHGKISSSSQKFERGFARACSDVTGVTIINVGGDAEHLDETIDGIRFTTSSYRNLFDAVQKVTNSQKAVVIATGYDPILMSVLVLCRALRLRVFTFIYDTHKTGMQNRRYPRKAFIGIYFGIGFFIARFVNGWIVLNDRFILASRFFTPRYLKTRIGVEAQIPDPSPPKIDSKRVLVFSGTLNADNGTLILLQSLKQIQHQNFELHVYGYGQLEHLVKDAAIIDQRIIFHGRVDNAEVVAMQQRAAALIHLRDPSSVSSNYSYPSKLIEYLWSGRPVASNLFPGIDDAAHHLIAIDEFNPASVAKVLSGILDGSIPTTASDDVRSHLLARQHWPMIAREVLDFVTGPQC